MQDTGSVARSAHPSVGDSDHIAHSSLEQFLRDRKHPPFGEPRGAKGTGIFEDQDRIGRDGQIRVVNPLFQIRIVFKNHRWTSVLKQPRR